MGNDGNNTEDAKDANSFALFYLFIIIIPWKVQNQQFVSYKNFVRWYVAKKSIIAALSLGKDDGFG